jgi:splicing suppressor protein 51
MNRTVVKQIATRGLLRSQVRQTTRLLPKTAWRHTLQKRPFSQTVICPVSFKSLFGGRQEPAPENKIIMEQDDLFHVLSKSPIPEMRDRAAIVKKYGVCPVCDTHSEGDDKKKPVYECPDCGYPTHCDEEHYHQGKAAHQETCKILREINEDDHDLRSGRPMREFEFPSKLKQNFIFFFLSFLIFVFL